MKANERKKDYEAKKAKVVEEAKKQKAELKKETESTAGQMRNRLLSKDSLVSSKPSKEVHWKDLPRHKKVSLIMSWVGFALAVVYVVIVAYSPEWWGEDCLLARVFNSKVYPATGNFFIDYAKQIFGTVFYFLAILGLAKLLRSILTVVSWSTSAKTTTILRLVNSAIKYASVLILIFIILGIWGVDTATILASAGVIALIIGLGAQSLIADIIGGLSIVFEQQFEIGDTVVIDDFRGVVSEICLTTTKLVDAAGNQKIIKNNQITSVINLSHDLSLAICDISIDYDEDLSRVRNILETNLPSIGKSIPYIIGKPTYLGVNEFQDSGIGIRIIAKTKEENKFSATRALNEAVYLCLVKEHVDIPFPQVVVSSRDTRSLSNKNKDEKLPK
jgi:small conductance mechanosensitive channel